jgi:tRNA threonylcarbamoyladenosine biosynthesis protein TsaB
MANFLLIDTSTSCCSVAIAKDNEVLHQEIITEGNQHATVLPAFVEACLKAINITLNDITAIGISIGPGSYTGLRVGLSFAKAICYANQIPLIAISTLQMMANGMVEITAQEQGIYLPMIDARRMEVFTAIINEKLDFIKQPYAKIITELFIDELPSTEKVFAAGNGAFKLKSFSNHHSISIIEEQVCQAKYLASPTFEKFLNNDFSDLVNTEPFYLKQFGEVIV